MPLSTTAKKSHIEMIECSVWSGFTVCKNSSAIFLGITKSHSHSKLSLSLLSPVSLSLSLSLSLESSFVLPSYNMTRLLSSNKLFALTSLEKWYRTGGNRTRFDPHLTWNTCICYGHLLLPLLQDWQLQVSRGRGFSVIGAIRKKCCSPSRFAWARLVKQLQLTPF